MEVYPARMESKRGGRRRDEAESVIEGSEENLNLSRYNFDAIDYITQQR